MQKNPQIKKKSFQHLCDDLYEAHRQRLVCLHLPFPTLSKEIYLEFLPSTDDYTKDKLAQYIYDTYHVKLMQYGEMLVVYPNLNTYDAEY